MRPFQALAVLPLLGLAAIGDRPSYAFFSGCGSGSAGGLVGSLPTSCIIGDKLYSDFSTDLPSSALISIGENGTTGKQHNLSITHAPGLAGYFNYKVAVLETYPNYLLSWQTSASGSIAPNDFVLTTQYTNSGAGEIAVNYSNANTGIQLFSGEPTSTNVTHTITGSSTLTGFSDTITQGPPDPVPAPLPLLGAAAVFGSVKRLRRSSQRIQHLTNVSA